MRIFTAMACVLVFACILHAQAFSPALLEWKQPPAAGDQWFLFLKQHCDGKFCYPERQVGTYIPATGEYYELLPSGDFKQRYSPPIPPPKKKARVIGQMIEKDGKENFGIDETKRAPRDKVTFQGREITNADAHALIEGSGSNTVPDDVSKPHLTIATKDAATKAKIESDLGTPEAAPLLDHYRVQVYDASRKVDAEMLRPFALERDPRYQKDGTVCLLQEPQTEGPAKVICAVGGWNGPAPLIAAARSADPTWDPSKVSGPSLFGSWPSFGDLFKGNGVWWIVGGLAALLLLLNTSAGAKAKEAGSVIFRPWITPAAVQTTVKRRRKTKTV